MEKDETALAVMIELILILIFLSFIYYWLLSIKDGTVFVTLSLEKMVFYRDYLFLTMIPYVYYLSGDRYRHHYILMQVDDKQSFLYAAAAAFVFIAIFLPTYKILHAAFSAEVKKIHIDISLPRLLLLLKFFVLISLVVFLIVSYKNNAGIFGLLSGLSMRRLAIDRAHWSSTGGFSGLNKVFVQDWIPMQSYLFYYLYLKLNKQFKIGDKLFFCLSCILGLLASIYFFEKSVLFVYIFGFAGIYTYAGFKLKPKYIGYFILLSLITVSLMYLVTYKGKVIDTNYLVDIIIHRTMTQCAGSIMAFDYFRNHDYLYFSGISHLLASIDYTHFKSVYAFLIDHYEPASIATSGAMSSFVTGDAYGLFGLVGIPISGVVVALYYSFFSATRNSFFCAIVFVGLYGLYFSHFYVASGFYGFIWPVGMILDVAPFVVLVFLSTKRRRLTAGRRFME